MSSLATTFSNALSSVFTQNGARSYSTPDCKGSEPYKGRLSLFFQGIRGLDDQKLDQFMRESISESLEDTFILAFYTRDCRGGKGERELGRKMFEWLAKNYEEQFVKLMKLIPVFGRWDDLQVFFPRVNSQISDVITKNSLLLTKNQLNDDLLNMNQKLPCSICAKWTPTENSKMDKQYKTFSALANYMNISPKNLRVKYNTPLRNYLKVVEPLMCSNQWDKIDFNQVPSCAMKRLSKAMRKHESERFNAWKDALVTGKTKVNAGQLYPHELVHALYKEQDVDKTVIEAQWKEIVKKTVEYTSANGGLSECLVVCDVSGSMSTTIKNSSCSFMDVAISLGILISQVVKEPWGGHLISFSEKPEFTLLDNSTSFESRVEKVKRMPWGMSTNFVGVFELILKKAVACRLTQEDMPKKVIVISDMQFNQACSENLTNINYVNQLYKKHGYVRPQIVFWNVSTLGADFPVQTNEFGTCLISGFSPSILSSITTKGDLSPIDVIRNCIDSERYKVVKELLSN